MLILDCVEIRKMDMESWK